MPMPKTDDLIAGARPLSDRVIVRRIEAPDMTPGGIYLPDSAKVRTQKGKVLAVGPGKPRDDGRRTPPEVREGQTVLFSMYAGNEAKDLGDGIVVMREDDILMVLTESK